MIDNYNPEGNLSPEEMAGLEAILKKFKEEVYDQIEEGSQLYELFDEVDFDDLVRGYILAQPNGTTMMVAWSWCWYDVVARGKKVSDIMDPAEV